LAIAEFLKTVKSKTPPIEDIGGDPLDETAGKNLYQSNCSICHAYGTGAPKVSEKPAWEHLLDQGKERLYEVAIKGDGPMPAKGNCKQCSDERIKAAVDYMIALALNKVAGTQDDEVETVTVLQPAKPLAVPNVVRDPHDVPAPIHRSKPTTVKLELTTTEVVSELADGSTYSFWTFNNTVPGPMLRVMVGDTVELTVKNASDSVVSHNVDLHAVNGPGGGAPMETVAPGETKTFKFKALNVGAFIYHCAFPPPYHHIAQGMYGAIIVEPVGGLPKVDREFYVMQGEWYTSGKFGQKGHQEFDEAKALSEMPEYFTFNGHATALKDIKPLQAKVGESIRIFFGNGGPNIGSNFHIIGEVFNKVYTGSPETYVLNEEAKYVPPGSVAIFELTLEVPGNYLLVDHALWRVAKGGLGILKVSGPQNDAIYLSGPKK
jgi:nitrite reductase (NO-forming)